MKYSANIITDVAALMVVLPFAVIIAAIGGFIVLGLALVISPLVLMFMVHYLLKKRMKRIEYVIVIISTHIMDFIAKIKSKL